MQKKILTAPNLYSRVVVYLNNSLQVYILLIQVHFRVKVFYDRRILIMVWTFWDCFLKTQLLMIDFSQYWHINSVPQNKFLYAAEELFCCKSLSTLFSNKLLFPSGKYHMFVHFHLSSIGLFTINAPIDKWFFVFGLLSIPFQMQIQCDLPCLLSK